VDALCADLPQRAVERGVVERGPAGERVEYALRHVRGGRLGEGEAEDVTRLAAVEQQPDDTLRQDMGLARPGVGRDPGGDLRVRGLDLPGQHLVGNGARLVHARSTRPASRAHPDASEAKWRADPASPFAPTTK